MDWFLYDRHFRHERVKPFQANVPFLYIFISPEDIKKPEPFLHFEGYKKITLA